MSTKAKELEKKVQCFGAEIYNNSIMITGLFTVFIIAATNITNSHQLLSYIQMAVVSKTTEQTTYFNAQIVSTEQTLIKTQTLHLKQQNDCQQLEDELKVCYRDMVLL